MTKFQIIGDSLIGRGLSFDVGSLANPGEKYTVIVDMANIIYRQGRESALFSYDDRSDLHGAVEALRALAVISGPSVMGDRYRRSADIIARTLLAQEHGRDG